MLTELPVSKMASYEPTTSAEIDATVKDIFNENRIVRLILLKYICIAIFERVNDRHLIRLTSFIEQ